MVFGSDQPGRLVDDGLVANVTRYCGGVTVQPVWLDVAVNYDCASVIIPYGIDPNTAGNFLVTFLTDERCVPLHVVSIQRFAGLTGFGPALDTPAASRVLRHLNNVLRAHHEPELEFKGA